ncbi:MAG: phage minor head protein [Treponemataceae bacterium]
MICKKRIEPYLKVVLEDFLNNVKTEQNDNLKNPFFTKNDKDLILNIEKCLISSYFLGSIHAENENSQFKINASDEDSPAISFDEAVNFLKRKISITKDNYYSLESKLKFRAFTVAKLGTQKAIENARKILIDSVEKGLSYSESWEQVKSKLYFDSFSMVPGYWENVFRTNSQASYVAGKLEKYESMKGVVGYQLFVIEDARTSHICRHLLTQSGRGFILPKDHHFWTKYGFPPYHFQCRTSIRAIFKSQIAKDRIVTDNPSMKSFTKFKPLDGFGGNPLDSGNWWQLTQSQMEQAIKYGILSEFNREENIFAVYNKVWKGYKRFEGKNGGWYDLCATPPNDWLTDNKPIVEFLAENGHKIKVIPDIQNVKEKYKIKWSNPDIILDGFLADIKVAKSSIKSRLMSAKKQNLKTVILFIPDSFTLKEIEQTFDNWSHGRLSVTWIYKGKENYRILK